MIEAALSFPDVLVRSLQRSLQRAGPRDAEVVLSVISGPDLAVTEQALNSFLNCCLDVSQVRRFVVLDAGLSARDRGILGERYGFVQIVHSGPAEGLAAQLAQLRAQVDGRFWLHLGQGWRFFAPERFITRLTAVFEAEARVFQVGINFADAVKLTDSCAAEATVRRAPGTGRYLLTDAPAHGPAMFDTTRLDRAAGLLTASLDEVLCIATV